MHGPDAVIVASENAVAVANQMHTNTKPSRAFGRQIHNHYEKSGFSDKSKRLRPKEPKVEATRDRAITGLRLSRPRADILEEYRTNIAAHLLQKDLENHIRKDYMTQQTDINSKMRAILVDWLTDVHQKFELLPQTLFNCVALMDRFLAVTEIKRAKLQLIGVACLMIVAKIEEVYTPMVKDYIAVCDNAYTPRELLATEGEILAAVSFNVLCPTGFTFLSNFNARLQLEDKLFNYAQYLLETSMLELSPLKHTNTVLAAGAIFFTNKLFKKEGWPADFEAATGVCEGQLRAAAKDLFVCLQKADKGDLKAANRKFAEPAFLEVSKYHIQRGGSKE
jgi:cyclin B